MGNDSRFKGKCDQSVIKMFNIPFGQPFCINSFDLAKGPAQKIKIMDNQIKNYSTAFRLVSIPIAPASREIPSSSCTGDTNLPNCPIRYKFVYFCVLREETDNMANK